MLEKSITPHYLFNASIGLYQSFGSYLTTYQAAFDNLYEQINSRSVSVDRVAYPMLFIARHCLELGYKGNVRYFAEYSGREDHIASTSHNLQTLYNAFKLHVHSTVSKLKVERIEVNPEDIKQFKEYCTKVETLNIIFEKLDHGSYSFRYPVDNSNNNVFDQRERINLQDVKHLLDDSLILLFHTANVFSQYTDYVDQMNEIYAETMASNYY